MAQRAPRPQASRLAILAILAILFSAASLQLAIARDKRDRAGDSVLEKIGALESKNDPKCYATAARLEDFMFGTPLSQEARFRKNHLMRNFVRSLWQKADQSRNETQAGPIAAEAITEALRKVAEVSVTKEGDITLQFRSPGGGTCKLSSRDIRQYASVAYSLRAILAVQQEDLLREDRLRSLEEAAIEELKRACDLVVLAVLQRCDREARSRGERTISLETMEAAWKDLLGQKQLAPRATGSPGPEASRQPVLRRIARQKLRSYAAYNQISNQLFVRNLQVYFSRLSWPKEAGEARAFRQLFTETVIAFAADLYREAAATATQRRAPRVEESDVAAAIRKFLPHSVNEYEDVTFFPRLDRAQRITIEAYDFDAFRDSGVHWTYLSAALDDLAGEHLPDADPFAAELLAEQVAQFGVLVLRAAGTEGARLDRERLSEDLLVQGLKKIQASIRENGRRKPLPDRDEPIVSAPSPGEAQNAPETLFVERGSDTGVRFMHRSSDWLNRLLRSYLRKDESTGIITIPPAFGGSGAAAEDVNGDGHPDLLLLSGSGNKLYLGDGRGRFQDVTRKSGLEYRREEDRAPGEPRQPIIADFDNDGHQDILITYVDDDHRLYRGRGDGIFDDVTARANLGGKGLVGGPATTFDFDGDGKLDIYLCYFGDYLQGVLPTLSRRNENGLPNRLFRNLGGMRFEDVTDQAGVGDRGWGQAAFHTDFDGDGRQDLISGNDFGVNRYFRNKGDGSFEEVSGRLGTDKPSYTMSISAADLNHDLRPDIYISNIVTMNKDEKYVLPGESTRMKFNLEKLAGLRVVEANDLFLSTGNQKRSDAARYHLSTSVGRGYSATGWAWDADFFDADLDGDDDLYVVNGMNEFNIYSSQNSYFMDSGRPETEKRFIPVAPAERNVFFENREGKLAKTANGSGLDFTGNSRSAVYLDWDGDGDLDVCVNNYHQAARLFDNRAEQRKANWIKIRLVGDPARGINRDAIGAQVIIRMGDRSIWRQVNGTTGYMSVHPKEIHAGLGTSSEPVSVDILWPNGWRQAENDLQPNRTHTIRVQSDLGGGR